MGARGEYSWPTGSNGHQAASDIRRQQGATTCGDSLETTPPPPLSLPRLELGRTAARFGYRRVCRPVRAPALRQPTRGAECGQSEIHGQQLGTPRLRSPVDPEVSTELDESDDERLIRGNAQLPAGS